MRTIFSRTCFGIQQQVYAPRQSGGCGEFVKVTGDFIVKVEKAIGNPNEGPELHFAEFRLLTAQFQRDVLESDGILDYSDGDTLTHYHDNVLQIFLRCT